MSLVNGNNGCCPSRHPFLISESCDRYKVDELAREDARVRRKCSVTDNDPEKPTTIYRNRASVYDLLYNLSDQLVVKAK